MNVLTHSSRRAKEKPTQAVKYRSSTFIKKKEPQGSHVIPPEGFSETVTHTVQLFRHVQPSHSNAPSLLLVLV